MSIESINTDEGIRKLDELDDILRVKIPEIDKLNYRKMLRNGDNASTDSQSVNSLYAEIMNQYPNEAEGKESEIEELINQMYDGQLTVPTGQTSNLSTLSELRGHPNNMSGMSILTEDNSKTPYLVTIHKYNNEGTGLEKDQIMAANLDNLNDIKLKSLTDAAKALPSTNVTNIKIDPLQNGGKRSKRKSSKKKSSKKKSSKRSKKGKRSTKHKRRR